VGGVPEEREASEQGPIHIKALPQGRFNHNCTKTVTGLENDQY